MKDTTKDAVMREHLEAAGIVLACIAVGVGYGVINWDVLNLHAVPGGVSSNYLSQ